MKVYLEGVFVGEVPNFRWKVGTSFALRLIGTDIAILNGAARVAPHYQPLFTVLSHQNGMVIEFPTPEKTVFINLQNRRPYIQVVTDDTTVEREIS